MSAGRTVVGVCAVCHQTVYPADPYDHEVTVWERAGSPVLSTRTPTGRVRHRICGYSDPNQHQLPI